MFPPFNQEIAHLYCLSTLTALEQGKIILERLTPESSERADQGLMVGCLVGRKAVDDEREGKNKRFILLAVSGISRQLKFACNNKRFLFDFIPEEYKASLIDFDSEVIIVPPIVSNEEINLALEKNDKEIHVLTEKINSLKMNKLETTDEAETLGNLCSERESLTTESLLNVFALYEFTRFDGKKISLNDIITEHYSRLPPTGTGDCCAPKLLSYAFSQSLQIESMDEVYYGNTPENNPAGKISGCSYAPCDERCGYILPSILGLEIIYRDDDIVVVNKQSGLLSVPGRGEDKQDCIVSRVRRLFPGCIEQPSVHRLDMETSGLMVLGLTQAAHDKLNAQFENRLVQKKYEALLNGVLFKADGLNAPKNNERSGTMSLKFRLDVENRPHQIYDEEYGKLGITEWALENIETYKNPLTGKQKTVSRISFIPHTGRTHQLRLASSDSHGFNLPIVGDTLYGTCEEGERLMLHACYLSFTHPTTGEKMEFYSKSEF